MKTAEEILAHCARISIDDVIFGNEVQIIRPSEALEAMEEYASQREIKFPSDKEIEGEAMTFSSYPAMPDGHPEFEVSRANDFDSGANWMKNWIKENNNPANVCTSKDLEDSERKI